MPLVVPLEERPAFYDPYYQPGALGAPENESDSRWFDEFSVLNHLHLPKQQGLSLNPPQVLRNSSSFRSLRNEYVSKHPNISTSREVSRDSNFVSCQDGDTNGNQVPESSTR